MATLDELENKGALFRVRINLRAKEYEERKIYAFPALWDWMTGAMRTTEPYRDNISLGQQARVLLKNFITGQPFEEGEWFWLMNPQHMDVYELKSADIRIFGWFYRPRIFIGVAGDTLERTHTYNLHAGYRNSVVHARETIDLDPPAYIKGASITDVFSI